MLPQLEVNSFLWLTLTTVVLGQLSHDPDELLNWCIDSKYHKQKPGPEDELHQQCTPWKDRSCCMYNTTTSLHNSGHYNMDWNHCAAKRNRPMSLECRRHFVQDLCFYECEPNLGPWTVKVDMKMRKERFMHVPVCASDCEVWYRDCMNDFTCVDNWTKKFVWINGKNTCPVDSECIRFGEMFRDAKHFCESIFDESFRYTADEQACMRLFFNGSNGNPNEYVARRRVDELMATWNGLQPHPSASFALVLLLAALALKSTSSF